MASKNQKKNRNLSLQVLEDRNMFAGNVLANLAGTHLAISGDVLDNQVDIAEIAPNTIQVTGLAGTTVNGAPMQVFAASLIEDVTVQSGDGRDQIVIHDLSLTDTPNGNLKVFTSEQDDQVIMRRVTTSNSIEIDTGDHNDIVRAFQVGTGGMWTTRSGNGHDSVAMRTVAAKEMVADTMDGNDRLRIQDGKIRTNLSVNTDTENDTVRIEQVRVGNDLRIQTGQGMDRVRLRDISAGNDAGVETGSESDTAVFSRVKARHNVFANTGTGDDFLIMHRVKAMNHIDVFTDSGDDQVYIMQSKAHDVYVDSSDGHDNVYMSDVNSAGDLVARLGDGDDLFRISNSSAVNPFFDGGPGFDIIHDLPNAFDEVLASINFELVI